MVIASYFTLLPSVPALAAARSHALKAVIGALDLMHVSMASLVSHNDLQVVL